MKETIHRQYCNVKKWLFESYQRNISEIDNVVNVEFEKYAQRENDLKEVAELLPNYSHSSSFVLKSKTFLERVKPVSTELNWSSPTYMAPEIQFTRFSEAFVTLSKRLFGHCAFDISLDKNIHFESLSRRLIRSQSLDEIPTFARPPQKPPSEILSKKSVSSSMSSLPRSSQASSTHRSAARTEIRVPDQCIYEVCLGALMK